MLKYKVIMVLINTFKNKTILCLLLTILLFSSLFFLTTTASAASYLDVNREGWGFTIIESDRGKLVVAESTSGSTAIYKFSYRTDGSRQSDIYIQSFDYYNQGNSVGCPSYIAKFRPLTGGTSGTSDQLWENNSSNCSVNPEALGDKGNVGVEYAEQNTDRYNSLLAKVKSINYGNEPIGCPGFAPIIGAPPTTDYNCPTGGAVISGSFKADGKVDGGIDNTSDERDGCADLGGPFGWIICGVGDLGDKIIDVFDAGMYALLDVPTEKWEQNGVKTAWETFRNLSSTLIVLVALVGIASQIFNFDFVSAYTIRKILPKLFIAIILIQLSWFLGTIMIQISNTVGYSIQSLIMAPFIAIAEQKLNTDITQFAFSDVMALFLSDADTPGATSFIGVSIMSVAAGFAVSSAIGAGGVAVLFMIMSALLTAGIALLVAFTVIAFRYALILALLVVMPIAIVAWVLPSTKKWFDKWWDLFFALLAMFPIIIAVLSFGKAAAIIIALSAGGN